MIKDESLTLANGVEIPAIAFGTWQILGEDAKQAVKDAISCGYRHIDTAANYDNEEEVGKAIEELGVRKDIFLVSKLRAEIKDYDEAIAAFNKTLKNLRTDYLDLYLIHAPWPWSEVGKDCTEGNIAVWKALIDLYNAGKIRAIGVSNFQPEQIESLIEATGFVPHVNQIRFFIGNTQEKIWSYCKDKGILVEAYSPLATGKLMEHEIVKETARKYNVTEPAICIRYTIERGTLPIVKSTHKERMIANLSMDFKLDKADVDRITGIEIPDEWKRRLRS